MGDEEFERDAARPVDVLGTLPHAFDGVVVNAEDNFPSSALVIPLRALVRVLPC